MIDGYLANFNNGVMLSGLVLSGGGARGAYQAGVLKAVCEMTVAEKKQNPFKLMAGISAGAINATYLASNSNNLPRAGRNLAAMWCRLTTDDIVSTNPIALGRIGVGLIKQLSTGALTRNTPTTSLLDTAPLEVLLKRHLKVGKIAKRISEGHLQGLAITATAYINSHARSFIQAKDGWQGWQRARRESQAAEIGVEHVMASSAIPVLFPPHKIGDHYFGDGGVRNTAPLSPVINLGAEQLLVVGVRMNQMTSELHRVETGPPSLARIFSVLVNGILMDGIDLDVERLERTNEMVDLMNLARGEKSEFKKINHIWISPSKYLGEVALKWADHAPKTIRYLIKGLGSEAEASDLFSYLLFEKDYCQELIQLGYQDAQAKEKEIREFVARARV